MNEEKYEHFEIACFAKKKKRKKKKREKVERARSGSFFESALTW